MGLTRIFIAGHNGMVGSSLMRFLRNDPNNQLITRSKTELDLTDQSSVRKFLKEEKPDQIYLAASKVGGIHANNTFPAEFIYQNLMIESNIIHSAFESGVDKIVFLGSSCIYPKMASQPMKEEVLLTGHLEPTNEPYAIAKIAGIKLCESYNRQYGTDYRAVMPTNLYGPGDNYHPENSHVIPALLRRIHEAVINKSKEVNIWGTGTPRREFLFVDDLAQACIFIMNLPKQEFQHVINPPGCHINVGYGSDITIKELAQKIAEVVGFKGEINFDPSKPDGTPRKLLDSFRINQLGWKPGTPLVEGLRLAYSDFLSGKRIFPN